MEESSQASSSAADTPAHTRKTNLLVIVQVIIIIILIVAFVQVYWENLKFKETEAKAENSLLSVKAYYGIGSKSFTIFNFEPLQTSMQSYISEKNLNVSVYVENLRNGANFGINSREGDFPGSLNKVPLAIIIMQEVERGKLSLDSQIPTRGIIASDSVEIYTNADSVTFLSEPTTSYTNNSALPLHILLENMLQKSDNNAFQILTAYVDKDALQQFLNYVNVDAQGSYNPVKASGQSNRLLSPKSLANIFLSLYYSTVLEPDDSEYILYLLANTTFNMQKTAQLADNVMVAHKYGVFNPNNERIFSDCGIIYDNRSRILYCITVRGQNEPEAVQTTAVFVRTISAYVAKTRDELDTYKTRGYV